MRPMQDTSTPLLRLSEWGVSFGEQPVLADLTWETRAPSVTIVMGPGGSGKSTLLRTLSGANDAQPSLRTHGHAQYRGTTMAPGGGPRPTLVAQHAKLLTATVRENLVVGLRERSRLGAVEQNERLAATLEELGVPHLIARLGAVVTDLDLVTQRHLAIARGYLTGEPLVLVDEPTFGLSPTDAASVLTTLAKLSETRALLATFHHRGHALELGGELVLLGGGRVLERTPTREFFEHPRTAEGKTYVATGGVAVPSLGADPATLDDAYGGESSTTSPAREPEAAAPIARAVRAPAVAGGPRHFYWAITEQIGGCPRPGVVQDEEVDVSALADLGITRLLCLEEVPQAVAACARHEIEVEHRPIPDMTAPSVAYMRDICAWIDAQLAAEQRVAVHCLAGLGRTGTVLASYLVWRGMPPLEAIDLIRVRRPRSIQTEAQADLVCAIAADRGPRLDLGPSPT